MKKSLIIFAILMMSVSLFAQTYPELSIKDIQFIEADSLLEYGSRNSEPKPALAVSGDTVIVTGVVMTAPYEGANPDSTRTLHAGAAAIFLQDTSMTEWSGILVRDPDASTSFAILDTGYIVKFKAVVNEYYTTTQLNAVDFQAQDVIGIQSRPTPVLLTLDSLVVKGSGNPNYLAEKWEGVYVEFRDVTTTEPGVLGYNTFRIFDNDNSNIVVGNSADYWRVTQAPLPGTKLDRIRGYIETRTNIQGGWFIINPVYPDDIVYGEVLPPNISDVVRDKGVVKLGESVTVSAKIIDRDGSVASAKIIYDVDSVNQAAIVMSTADSIWTGVIPAFNDSVFVSYYIMAVDNEGNVSYSPTDTVTSRYFYKVLNRDLTIQDVQYSPFGSGFSGYHNYTVTVTGVVTADTSDIPGFGGSGARVHIQNGVGPWSGILIFGAESEGLVRGDKVQVTGIVNETFGVTRIGNLDQGVQVTVLGSGVEPEATLLSTSDIDGANSGELPAESYEGVLIKYQNVTVVDENADGNPGPDEGTGGNRNFGEILVADGSAVQTRVELQEGNNDYHNFWSADLENEPIRVIDGATFDVLAGIMYYSFGNYKLIPRKNGDFVGYTDVEKDAVTPNVFSLSQNYPNPFNPSTIIQYSIPMNEFVTLKVYDVLGREVQTLVNKEQSAGVYNVEFNASKLTSGVYFYRIEAGSFVSVRKLLLLK
ncbi:MAG: T9SS type A sorting domain-containing protein [Chlorobi bacterium]|nr:T9SS type A sorting domain-containing protein [Chlorobiota bacterium]